MQRHGGELRLCELRTHAVIAGGDAQVLRYSPAETSGRLQRACRKGIDRHAKGIEIGIGGEQAFGRHPATLFARCFVDPQRGRVKTLLLREGGIGCFRLKIGVSPLVAGNEADPPAWTPEMVEQKPCGRGALHIDEWQVRRTRLFPDSDHRNAAVVKEGDERVVGQRLDHDDAVDLDRAEVETGLQRWNEAEGEVAAKGRHRRGGSDFHEEAQS